MATFWCVGAVARPSVRRAWCVYGFVDGFNTGSRRRSAFATVVEGGCAAGSAVGPEKLKRI